MKYLIFDISNMLHRTFHANKQHDVETNAGLAHHTALTTLNKYFRQFMPHKVIMAFDRSSWRKVYTADPTLCISGKKYKGQRRQNMTPAEREKYARFLDHLNDFERIMKEHTSVVCLAGDGLEADDLVGGFVQMHPDDEIIIVSADRDLMQLLSHPNVKLIDPASGKDRRKELVKDYDNDTTYFMFEKCIRGDTGDNIQSAYPGVRKTRIKKAYVDSFERVNLMNEVWSLGIPGEESYKEYVVKQLFEENELLMNLEKQPDVIRQQIQMVITEAMKNPGTYSHFHFLRFLGKYELKKVAENIDNFVKMLSR